MFHVRHASSIIPTYHANHAIHLYLRLRPWTIGKIIDAIAIKTITIILPSHNASLATNSAKHAMIISTAPA